METKDSNQLRITNTILLNASFINNIGLMNGKLGISILFYHLARQYKNKIYEDYAGELIDEIYEEITPNTSVNFENGLAGIGWGIEHLVQNGFIEANTDEVLSEFDETIFHELVYNTPKEIGLLNGIIGFGAYFLERIQNKAIEGENVFTLTNKKALAYIVDELDKRLTDISEIIAEPNIASNSEMKQTQPIFDITWDYNVLLLFLKKLHQHNLFKEKTEKIIQRLLVPIEDTANWPQLHGNRLLLKLTLIKLQKTKEFDSISTANVLPNIERREIESELKNISIKNGLSGIVWAYRQLYQITKNEYDKTELDNWELQMNNSPMLADSNFEISDLNSTEELGILKGWAGSTLINIK